MLATVVAFSEQRGDGEVMTNDGRRLYFHCVEIADGTRRIEVGARVAVVVRPGRLGVDEATQLALADGPASRTNAN